MVLQQFHLCVRAVTAHGERYLPRYHQRHRLKIDLWFWPLGCHEGPAGTWGKLPSLRAGGGEDGTTTSRSRLRYGHAARFPRRCGVCGRAPRTHPGPCPHPQGSVPLCSPRQAPAWVSVSPQGPVASACWWHESRPRALLTTGAQTGENQARAQ